MHEGERGAGMSELSSWEGADAYSEALEGVLLEVPYNSATEFLARYGTSSPDPRLGAACIYQTMEVARRAESLGAPAATLLQDERHVGAVWETDEGIVVLDPYLLHREPIRFPRAEVEAGMSVVEVSAAPVRRESSGRAREARIIARYKATDDDGYLVRLSYSKYSPKREQYVLNRHFTLRSESLFNLDAFTADMPALLTHPEQNSLSIRALTPDLETIVEAILPLQHYARGPLRPEDVWLRHSNGGLAANGAPQSEELWVMLEEVVAVSRVGIIDHILSAAEIYRTLAHPGTVLEGYQLEEI